jgi:hypothetical protein
LIPLELLCARLAYETLGEIASSIYFIGVITLNIVCILIAYRYRAIAALCAVGLSLIIIPYQIMLGNRLLRVQAEVTRLVTYVYEQKI